MEKILTDLFSLCGKQVEIEFKDGSKNNLYKHSIKAQVRGIKTNHPHFILINLWIEEDQSPKGIELSYLRFYPEPIEDNYELNKWCVDTSNGVFPAAVKTV